MNKNIGIGIGVIILVLIAGVTYASMAKKDDMMKQDTMTEENKMMEKEVMMKKDETTMMDKKMDTETMMKGSYEAYSPEKIMRAETGDVVLFFHASWCPSCRGLNSDIEANMNAIPQGVTILKVDYDKETELKKKYGVTTQHTLVQVDKDGNMIKKWSGGSRLANLVSEIQ
jgi:thiol-disulfide isomerase/thioredoxin